MDNKDKVSRAIFVNRPGESTWVSVQEYPGDKIVIEGIRMNTESESLQTQRILLSKECIEKITPMLVDWLESKKGD